MAKFEVTEDVIKKAAELARNKATMVQMAEYFGMKKTCWHKHCSQNEELANAIKKARVIKYEWVVSKLYQKIEEGDTTAIIFYLKTQAKWSDKVDNKIEIGEGDDKVAITSKDPVEAAKMYKEIMESGK
jgi:hypothetical protein